MARKKKSAPHENHERWLVSYADFITLLFAFFVVMFASSHQDSAKAKQVSDSVREAIENGGLSSIKQLLVGTSGKKVAGGKETGGTAPGGQLSTELGPSLEYLTRELKAEIDAGTIQIALRQRGLIVSLREAAFFPSGDDTIYETTYPTMEKLAKLLRDLPNPVRLEGHTDSIPIHNARFRSNWELSAARSIAVMELFRSRLGVAEDRFAIAGYAENIPVDSNETAEGRARNRRVDVVILSGQGLAGDAEGQTPAPQPEAAQAQTQTKSTSVPAHAVGKS